MKWTVEIEADENSQWEYHAKVVDPHGNVADDLVSHDMEGLTHRIREELVSSDEACALAEAENSRT